MSAAFRAGFVSVVEAERLVLSRSAGSVTPSAPFLEVVLDGSCVAGGGWRRPGLPTPYS
jgi:hypothetical protein